MVDLIGAVALLGAILLPVNFRLNAAEIACVLSDGGPVVIVAGAEYHEAIVALKGGRRRPSARRAAVAARRDRHARRRGQQRRVADAAGEPDRRIGRECS